MPNVLLLAAVVAGAVFRDPPVASFAGVTSHPSMLRGSILAAPREEGLVMYNLSDPQDPVVVGTLPVAVNSFAMSDSTDIGCVYDTDTRLYTVNFTDPARPVLVGELPRAGWQGRLVGVSATTAYIDVYHTSPSLRLVSIAEPSAPRRSLRMFEAWDGALGINGNYTYFRNYDEQLVVLHGDPPQQVGNLPADGIDRGYDQIFMAGGYLYGLWWGGLRIWSVDNPAQPVVVGEIAHQGSEVLYCAAVVGDFAYVSSHNAWVGEDSWLRVYNMSDPSGGTYEEVAQFLLNRTSVVCSVDVVHGHAVIWNYRWVDVYDLGAFAPADAAPIPATPASAPVPPPLPNVSVTALPLSVAASDVVVDGDVALVLGESGGTGVLVGVNLSDPLSPSEMFNVSAGLGSSASALAVMETADGMRVVAVARLGSQLSVLDVKEGVPQAPDTSSLCTSGLAVAIVGDVAYVVTTSGICKVLLGTMPPTHGTPAFTKLDQVLPVPVGLAVSASADYLYVVGSTWLSVVRASDSGETGRVRPGQYGLLTGDVVVRGDTVLAADRSGLQVFNVSSPSEPTHEGGMMLPFVHVVDMAVSGDRAYLCDRQSKLHVVDISNPAKPHLLRTYGTSSAGLGRAVAVYGRYVLVFSSLGSERRVEVLDIPDVIDTPVPTPAPEAPPTPQPDTPVPTPQPDTGAPTETPVHETPEPDTPPPTPMPTSTGTPTDTPVAPPTPAPDTPAPDTLVPDTPAPVWMATSAPTASTTSPTPTPATTGPTSSPRPTVMWCTNDAICQLHGDTAAKCLAGGCVCGEGYSVSGGTPVCSAGGDSGATAAVQVRLVWSTPCTQFTDTYTALVRESIDAATRPAGARNLRMQCDDPALVAYADGLDYAQLADVSVQAELARRYAADARYAGMKAALGAPLSVRMAAVLPCDLQGTAQWERVADGSCRATACQPGWSLAQRQCVVEGSSNDGFPAWAIAVIVLGGVVVLATTALCWYKVRTHKVPDFSNTAPIQPEMRDV